MTGTRRATPKAVSRAAAATEVDAAHLQYLIRAIIAATEAAGASLPQGENGHSNEHVVVDTDLDGVRYLLIRMPAVEPMRAMLSPREFEIVRMVARGHQNKIIAGTLNISAWTVCAHLRRVFAKFGVNSRAAMVARLLETDISLQSSYGAGPAGAISANLPRALPHEPAQPPPPKAIVRPEHAPSSGKEPAPDATTRRASRGSDLNQRRMLLASRQAG
jgi:DNA-binding CsgD family transcriptional regulator